jgi:predicted amidophosphoribosyltransferase
MDDAFETSLEVQNHQILLLDDVMTTGSTLNAAARCLKEAGANQVGALVLGRKMWDSFEDGFTDA